MEFDKSKRMIDEQNETTKKEETQVTQSGFLPPSNTPTSGSQTQAQESGEHRKYRHYITWPIVAFRWLVQWLDTNYGAVTAAATVVIAILTFFYVRYAKNQWRVMDDQTQLQKRIAKLNYGAPNIQISDLKVFYSPNDKALWADLTVQNYGTEKGATAQDISIAQVVEFSDEEPEARRYSFKKSDFQFMKPPNLPVFQTPNPTAFLQAFLVGGISPKEYPDNKTRKLYIWGKTAYTDYTGPETPVPFCRYVLGKAIFDRPPSDKLESTGGYSGPYYKCEHTPAF